MTTLTEAGLQLWRNVKIPTWETLAQNALESGPRAAFHNADTRVDECPLPAGATFPLWEATR
jgi:hypothetical protein